MPGELTAFSSADSQGWVAGSCPPQEGTSQKTRQSSIRYLLCDDEACAVCGQLAERAAKETYQQRLDLWLRATGRLPVPSSTPDVERGSRLSVTGSTGQHVSHQSSPASSLSLPGSGSPLSSFLPSSGEECVLCAADWLKDASSVNTSDNLSASRRKGGSSSLSGYSQASQGTVDLQWQEDSWEYSSESPPERKRKERVFPDSKLIPSSWDLNYEAVQRHVAKKAREVQQGVFQLVAQSSQASANQGRKRPLPKTLPLGKGVVQPLCQEVPFATQTNLDRIKPPTLRRTSLASLPRGTTPPASGPLLPTAVGFPGSTETPSGAKQTREELDWQVRRKQGQHTWGLPGSVQRTGHEKVTVSQEKLSSPSRETVQNLEHDVQKRGLLQPRVAPRSRQGPCPEMEQPPCRGRATRSHLPCSPSPEPLSDHHEAGRKAPAPPYHVQLCPMVTPKDLEKMAHHVAKKLVEMQLGVLPTAARQSQRLASLSTRQPLPRLISRGQRDPRPRQGCPPLSTDVHRIDMAVRRRHLASLWGLGWCYVETLAGMVPTPPSSWRSCRHPGSEFPEPFLPQQDIEALELSISKKRLQHEWGLPGLVQKSLKAVTEDLPTLPVRSQTEIQVMVLQHEPSFHSRSILTHLEIHVQKMKLQRQWGLPRMVLESIKALGPEPGSHLHGQEVCPVSPPMGAQSTRQSTQEAKGSRVLEALSSCPQPYMLRPRDLERLSLHASKKCLEVRLEAFPALVQLSWRRMVYREPLPKLLLPGHCRLQPCSHFLPFVQGEAVERLELSVRHHHLSSLWGLGTLYVEAVAGMVPQSPSRSCPSHMPPSVFSEAKTPFLQGQDRETLELQVKRMQIQHMWGLPSHIQRALRAFMHKAPPTPVSRRTNIAVHTQGLELPFLSPDQLRTLELHIQKMTIQRRWGLPSRLLKMVKKFLSTGTLRKVRSDRRPGRSSSPLKREPPSAKDAGSAGSGRHKEVHPSHMDPPKASALQPAVHSQLPTKGSKTPPTGKKAVPSTDVVPKAGQRQTGGRGQQGRQTPGLLKEGTPTKPSVPPRSKKSISEKVSLIGSILDMKLHLTEGLHTWLSAQKSPSTTWKEKDRKPSAPGAQRPALQQDAKRLFSLMWKSQCDRRPGSSSSPSKREPLSAKDAGSGHHKEAHPSHMDPPKASVPRPAVRSQLPTKGSKTPPTGKKAVPSTDAVPKAAQRQTEGRGQQGRWTPGLLKEGTPTKPSVPPRSKKSVSKKVSIIGSILDRKLHLEEGLHTWLSAQKCPSTPWKEKDRKPSAPGSQPPALQHGAKRPLSLMWESQCSCRPGAGSGSARQASGKAQGPLGAQTTKAQPSRASRKGEF